MLGAFIVDIQQLGWRLGLSFCETTPFCQVGNLDRSFPFWNDAKQQMATTQMRLNGF